MTIANFCESVVIPSCQEINALRQNMPAAHTSYGLLCPEMVLLKNKHVVCKLWQNISIIQCIKK